MGYGSGQVAMMVLKCSSQVASVDAAIVGDFNVFFSCSLASPLASHCIIMNLALIHIISCPFLIMMSMFCSESCRMIFHIHVDRSCFIAHLAEIDFEGVN